MLEHSSVSSSSVDCNEAKAELVSCATSYSIQINRGKVLVDGRMTGGCSLYATNYC